MSIRVVRGNINRNELCIIVAPIVDYRYLVRERLVYASIFYNLTSFCLYEGVAELESKSAELKEKVAVTRAEAKETEASLKAQKQQLAAWNNEISSKVCSNPYRLCFSAASMYNGLF